MRNGCVALRRRNLQHVAVALAVAHRKRLRDDHRVLADRLAQLFARVGGALEQQSAVLEHDVERTGAEHREVAVVDEIDVAKLDRAPPTSGCLRDRGDHLGRHRLLRADGRPNARADEQVGLQRLADPVDHRVAEAADHHRDRHHHRQAHRQAPRPKSTAAESPTVRLACASRPSTPSRRRSDPRPSRARPNMIAGTRNAAPITSANDDA